MLITIWRHGEAGPAKRDHLRTLTRRGQVDIGIGAERLRNICQERQRPLPDQLLYSPWQRTAQTAELIAESFELASSSPSEALLSDATVHEAETALQQAWESQQRAAHLVLVSHQPLVSLLADALLGCVAEVPPLPPGGLVSLQLSAPALYCGELLWWAFPPHYESQR